MLNKQIPKSVGKKKKKSEDTQKKLILYKRKTTLFTSQKKFLTKSEKRHCRDRQMKRRDTLN